MAAAFLGLEGWEWGYFTLRVYTSTVLEEQYGPHSGPFFDFDEDLKHRKECFSLNMPHI